MRAVSLRLLPALALAVLSGCALHDTRSDPPRLDMIEERPSPFGLEETVEALVKKAKSIGWVVPGIKKLEKNIKKHGGPDVLPVRLVEICQPHHSGKRMLADEVRSVSVLMPCTLAVYLKKDGKIYVSYLKVENLAPMMGELVGEVMGGPVAADQAKILEALEGK